MEPWPKVRAMTALVKAAAAAGDLERARMLAREAEEIACTIAAPVQQASALTGLMETLAITGEHYDTEILAVGAEAAVRSITNPRWKAEALAALVSQAPPSRAR
jgi:hypothetical protein